MIFKGEPITWRSVPPRVNDMDFHSKFGKLNLNESMQAPIRWFFLHGILAHNLILHSLIHSSIHSFNHSFIHSFIHLFIHSLIHSFILTLDKSRIAAAINKGWSRNASVRSKRINAASFDKIVMLLKLVRLMYL